MRPPCQSTMRLTIASPMPLPSRSSRGCSVWNIWKTFLGVLFRNADAVVLDGERDRVALVLRIDAESRPALRRRVMLDGVVDQVAQHLLERGAIRADCRQALVRLDLHAFGGAQQRDDVPHEFPRVDHGHLADLARRPRVREQVVEQPVQAARALLQQSQVFLHLALVIVLEVVAEPFDEDLDRPQRRLQVVRRDVRELLEVAIRTLEFFTMPLERRVRVPGSM